VDNETRSHYPRRFGQHATPLPKKYECDMKARAIHSRNNVFISNSVSGNCSQWIYVHIGNEQGHRIRVKAIKDNGADKTLMNLKLFTMIPGYVHMTRYDTSDIQFRTVDDGLMDIVFAAEVYIRFTDERHKDNFVQEPFMVLITQDMTDDFIIGNDILYSRLKIIEDRKFIYLTKDRTIQREVNIHPSNSVIRVPIQSNHTFAGKRIININYLAQKPIRTSATRDPSQPNLLATIDEHTDEERSDDETSANGKDNQGNQYLPNKRQKLQPSTSGSRKSQAPQPPASVRTHSLPQPDSDSD